MQAKHCCALLLLVLCALLPAPATGQALPNGTAKEQLVGAWRLVSIETIRSNGEVIFPFYGKHPEGILMYDGSGWMSVQIVSDPTHCARRLAGRGHEGKRRRQEQGIRQLLRVLRYLDHGQRAENGHTSHSTIAGSRGAWARWRSPLLCSMETA